VNGNQWSVSVRGTVGVYTDKLLVLIDGRSIYSPVFSGVYWDLGMPLLEDIDRIEVIRGPGATIWGANAVLGVINIITKKASETHGTTVTAGAGTTERAFGSVSTGGAIGSTNYRVFFGGFDDASLSQASGAHAGDQWSSIQGGFRLDGAHGHDTWMIEGGLSRTPENTVAVAISVPAQQLLETPFQLTDVTGNLTGEWRRRIGEKGELRVSAWYDYADKPEPLASEVETRTSDIDAKYDFTAGRHNLSLGGGERTITADIFSQQVIIFTPERLTYVNLNAFAQDEIHFHHDTVLLTLGAKLEHNHFGGWGPEPSANLLWMPRKNESLWISTAQSLRTPSLEERDVFAPYNIYPGSPLTGGLPVVTAFAGSSAFGAEKVTDFEAGYRAQLSKRLSADFALFYDRFSDMRSFTSGATLFVPGAVPYLQLVQTSGNSAAATGKGGEVSLAWEVLRDWKLEGSYSYAIVDSWVAGALPGTFAGDFRQGPRNKWRLQSYVNLSKAWKIDTLLYWTGESSPTYLYGPSLPIPAYTRLDVRLGYRAGSHWQLSLAGQNLLQARHLEGMPDLITGFSYVNRGVYLKSTWRF
jgi:iron complex outermembrane receptor protein